MFKLCISNKKRTNTKGDIQLTFTSLRTLPLIFENKINYRLYFSKEPGV